MPWERVREFENSDQRTRGVSLWMEFVRDDDDDDDDDNDDDDDDDLVLCCGLRVVGC
mgnify:CR=1 FL=1